MATIRDVARESGVSVATVSYVLNNGPRPVKAQTRDRVRAVMDRLDYQPNAMARGLVSRRLQTIGVLFGQIETSVVTNPYAATVLQGILSAAAEADYNVTIFPQQWQGARRSAAPLRDRRTDGVLVVAPTTDSDMVSGIAALRLPSVVVSAPGEAHGVASVDVDNGLGGRLAAEHLLSLGHRRIAHLHGRENHNSVAERRDSFLGALREAGVAVRPEYVVPTDYGGWDGMATTTGLLRLPEPPTAIFAGNDMIAFKVLDAARALGVAVPEQLSVIGFDDVPSASLITPPLTTVRQPLVEIGRCATRLLLRQIEDGEKAAPRRASTNSTIPWEGGAIDGYQLVYKREGTVAEGSTEKSVVIGSSSAAAPQGQRLEPTLVIRATTAPPPTQTA